MGGIWGSPLAGARHAAAVARDGGQVVADLEAAALQQLGTQVGRDQPGGKRRVAAPLFELIFVVGAWVTAPQLASDAPTPPASEVSNTKALGELLYTDYVYLFEAAGLILLVAMIGAIVLTLRHRADIKPGLFPEKFNIIPHKVPLLIYPSLSMPA